MGIQVTDERNVALFDSVTGVAFGPVFDDVPEAEAFVRWWNDRHVATQQVDWLSGMNADAITQRAITSEWRTHLTDHAQDDCPWDRDVDSYGQGFTGDSDKSHGDYTAATPDSCSCECHKRPGGAFVAEGRR
jgi:hypothetical protein